MSKQYSVRELQKMLKSKGFKCIRISSSHAIYSNGKENISLPIVSLNYKIANKIVRKLMW